jgi:hypothetical protein
MQHSINGTFKSFTKPDSFKVSHQTETKKTYAHLLVMHASITSTLFVAMESTEYKPQPSVITRQPAYARVKMQYASEANLPNRP